MKNCRCIVKGRVQGVWFRRFTQNIANELGISGWVRNLPDGSVEVEASVPDEVYEEFLQALHEGPPLARVDEVVVEEIERSYSGAFEVRR
ncbi:MULTISPECIES: acylphosphatase [Nitratiruptor]|uniref:acylphosphatase n=1 Tax=Nitratiruptor tergarcus DSM 16512 TaxID=1069081 RepID=A0A1W1WUB8_9BACT|nr:MULTISPECIES: acylphosphatase [Nitratiruptor]BCD62469.1 acylphosphatase [Nitratiruptor sp. YY08-13]BCD66405.1 acylphosphatase [Nitratiruptor sp. YY08-26]SMC09877.1 acylphosphatase [Nitratiruptor tergarcus DSM 16512]